METILLGGFHAVSARLQLDPQSIDVVYVDPTRRDKRMRDMRDRLIEAGVRVMNADAQRLDRLCPSIPHQGIVAQAKALEPKLDLHTLLDEINDESLILVLDSVTDPRNFGAALRVADAAGVTAVVVPKDRSAGMTPAAVKAAAGASETVPVVEVTNLASTLVELQDAGVLVLGLAGEGTDTIYDKNWCQAVAIVMGAEGEGLRQLTRKRCDELIKIPMLGAVESLNVSVAAGITLYEAVRQRMAQQKAQ